MLKIDFFQSNKIDYYENKIAKTVKSKNGGKDEIIFIPEDIKNPNTGEPYKISIHDLLTLERDDVLKIDGIKLYMLICSAQKYKSKSIAKLLNTLHSEYPAKVKIKHDHGDCEYMIGDVRYRTNVKKAKERRSIIVKAAKLIKDEFAGYSKDYADSYFDHDIVRVEELNAVLNKMFNDAKDLLNGTQGLFIDYSIISGDLRHELMSSLEIRTCPYCNRNYITVYGNGKRSTADLDHFYQKTQYPLFALSLFNFIPSCQICNSRMKNTRSAENTLYPYKEGFENDAHFELKYTGKDKTWAGILHLWQAIKDVKYDDFKVKIVPDPAASHDKKEDKKQQRSFLS